MRVLTGDIGGTKTLLQIADAVDDDVQGRTSPGARGSAVAPRGVRVVAEQRFDSAAFADFASMLRVFLDMERAALTGVTDACFAVAGPVRDTPQGQSVKVTNLPWEISARALQQEFGFPRLRLINDFEAIGYGIEALAESDFTVLQAGEPAPHGPRAVIGAGTGLGQAILLWQGDRYAVVPTEGGHASFGPTDELQLYLAHNLIKEYGRASYELILSGPGLARLYAFLKKRGVAPESPAVARAMANSDPAAAIADAALKDNDPLANQTLDLFVRIYGTQAGNLALSAGATGGLYIAGGIAPKIISRLTDGAFLAAFRDRGNMSAYVAAVPVRVVMNTNVGLIGAVMAASH